MDMVEYNKNKKYDSKPSGSDGQNDFWRLPWEIPQSLGPMVCIQVMSTYA